MTTSEQMRRLAALKTLYQADDPAAMTDTERAWVVGLSASSLLATVHQFAVLLAERRYVHEVGLPADGRSAWAGDWTGALSQDERDARAEAELERLAAITEADLDRALAAWIGVVDQEEWPSFRNLTFGLDLAGFWEMFTRRRQGIDLSCHADMLSSSAWRRAHPSWRPGMEGAEALTFEWALIAGEVVP